jgi:hypothetical protein
VFWMKVMVSPGLSRRRGFVIERGGARRVPLVPARGVDVIGSQLYARHEIDPT